MSRERLRDIAIVGAAGACGRQLAVQLLDEHVMDPAARLQLVSHRGGTSESETHGLRADLRDAFADDAPTIELVDEPAAVDADILVMLAGATVPTDPRANVDRIAIARRNESVFRTYAEEMASRDEPPVVIVQSNPVELGVATFSRRIGRHRVVGAGAYSDTLRFRREVADTFGVRRSHVSGLMLGQHGDHLVPVWSSVRVDGPDPVVVAERIAELRRDPPLDRLADAIVHHRAELLGHVARGDVHGAFARAMELPPPIRAAVKPFLVHTTAGHTTEIVTAHAVAEIIGHLLRGESAVVPVQVELDGELGLRGVGGMTVRLGPDGWTDVVDPGLEADELDALRAALTAVDAVIDLSTGESERTGD